MEISDAEASEAVVSRSPSPARIATPEASEIPGQGPDAGFGLMYSGRLVPVSSGSSKEFERVANLQQLGFCDRTWLVSRKRNKNLFDLVQTWKRQLLNNTINVDGPDVHMDVGF